MFYLKSGTIQTVPTFLKEHGFSAYPSEPTDEDAEQFIEVMVLTGRSDLKFTPIVNVVYEKKLSGITSLIVEAYKEKNASFYSP